jgi:hypothetical protein
VVQCLVQEFGADVNQATNTGVTALFYAAEQGHEAAVKCIVEELCADVNQATHDGRAPLMAASWGRHKMVAKFLIKYGADPQASTFSHGTAANVSQRSGAPAHLTAYLEAKAQCASPGCDGTGLRKCTVCKWARYCGQQCQRAHWPVHKAECKQRASGQKASKEN